MESKDDPRDRRQFPRLKAPVFCRPVRLTIFQPKQRAIDISAGGVRIYSDEEGKIGEKLDLELFLSDGSPLECRVEVVWIDPLGAGAPARFDVGLKFIDLSDADRSRLTAVIDADSQTDDDEG